RSGCEAVYVAAHSAVANARVVTSTRRRAGSGEIAPVIHWWRFGGARAARGDEGRVWRRRGASAVWTNRGDSVLHEPPGKWPRKRTATDRTATGECAGASLRRARRVNAGGSSG